MAVSAREIQSYTGDAGRSLARNAGALDVFGDTNTQALGQTARDLALASYGKNQELFRQKIRDRDDAFRMLDEGTLPITDVLEENRDMLNKKRQKILDIYYNAGGNIKGDPKVYREFLAATKDADDHIKQAQKWYLGAKAELDEMGKLATNPIERAKREAHLSAMVKAAQTDFWNMPKPYVAITDFDLTKVAAPPPYGAAVVTQERGADGLPLDVTTQKVDTLKLFDEYQKQWAKPEQNHWFAQYVDRLLVGPNADGDIARLNALILKNNALLGLKPGMAGYVTELGVAKDAVTGKYVATKDRPDQIAAKIAFADSEPVKTTKVFAQERAQAKLGLGKLAEERRHNIAMENMDKGQLKLAQDKFDRENASSTKGLRNAAFEFATNMIGDIGKNAIQMQGGGYILQADRYKLLTDEQKKYLGYAKLEDGKTEFTPMDLKGNEVLIVTKDNKILKLDKDKLVYNNGVYKWSDRDAIGQSDITQVATNRLKDEVIVSTGQELGPFVGVDADKAATTTGGSERQSKTSSESYEYIQKNPKTGERQGWDGTKWVPIK